MARDRPDLAKYVGQERTVVAWLWARTVKSPNPAFAQVDVPLATTFLISSKPGRVAFVEPIVKGVRYRFVVKVGKPIDAKAAQNGTKVLRGSNFQCVMSGTPIAADYIMAEGKAGRIGARMMAIVAQGERERLYLQPTPEMEEVARKATPRWKPAVEFFQEALGFRVGNYGMTKWSDLFTDRQIVALTMFSDLVQEARERAKHDALATGMNDDGQSLADGGTGATAYADALGVYLAFVLDKTAAGSSSLCTWMHQRDSLCHAFAKQTLSMTWDFAEVNVLADCTRSLSESTNWTAESLEGVAVAASTGNSVAEQSDAQTQSISSHKVISTDPPYYDNIGYADLSDFFYV
jgi:putative DNA methylase